ncbi:hypothetical protein P152DRAFT_457210 [Eremomyces bilateralis CBS 781.70]|uniref:Uncharacterized protein n=1 Tax=Eremomyces bilateralis CBS 781.70 TaxID=1392243 RepID=A0A6G1G6Y8_9PEZI|nr:uncharacterized protein P152DRAFT_457210 [Eremomyces bilateralis CBS 781.70]KAF1813837.1 hypothetical protein P152DRAFT_457210 [Eremomyces bilateralis CBS 781.70]
MDSLDSLDNDLKKMAGRMKSETNRNTASSGALQINAPVVRNHREVGFETKIETTTNYVTIHDLHVHYSASIRTESSLRSGATVPAVTSGTSSTNTRAFPIAPEPVRPSTPLEPYIKIFSRTEGEWSKACAKLSPDLDGNWMSKRIVGRFDLKLCPDETTKEVEYQGRLLVSCGVVELSCSPESCRHRFHVFRHAPFDILLGKEFA